MIDFGSKTEYTLEDIQSLVNAGAEESSRLEFKASGALDKSDRKRDDISKDIAAFANSDGGVIVYGIAEKEHKAHSIDPVDGNEYTKEWLAQVISSNIQRSISALEIYPIRIDGDIGRSIYVVKIPASLDAPHMSRDKRFYKRSNFEAIRMEEFDVRSLYGRKLKSKLIIDNCRFPGPLEMEDGKAQIPFEVVVFNDGDVAESDYNVNLYIQSFSSGLTVTWNRTQGNIEYTDMSHDENPRIKVSAASTRTLFPGEISTAMRIVLSVNPGFVTDFQDKVKASVSVHYANGVDEMDYEDFARHLTQCVSDVMSQAHDQTWDPTSDDMLNNY